MLLLTAEYLLCTMALDVAGSRLPSSPRGAHYNHGSIQTRRTTLVAWDNLSQTIGWTQERRDTMDQTYNVSVVFGTDGATKYACLVRLPYIDIVDGDSLASTLWPVALAGAILCRSPRLNLCDKSVIELGAGLGLAGWTSAVAAGSCLLTDVDDEVIRLQQKTISLGVNRGTVDAAILDWRDDREPAQKYDVVVATDVAYYHHLLGPLMETTQRHLCQLESIFLCVGQANRASQWDLWHNICEGCYNQRTDARDAKWDGSTHMLLYKLQVEKWKNEDDKHVQMDGTIPVAAILHCNPGAELVSLTSHDYFASKKDEEALLMAF